MVGTAICAAVFLHAAACDVDLLDGLSQRGQRCANAVQRPDNSRSAGWGIGSVCMDDRTVGPVFPGVWITGIPDGADGLAVFLRPCIAAWSYSRQSGVLPPKAKKKMIVEYEW